MLGEKSKTTSPSIVLNVAGNVVNNGIVYRTSQYRVRYWILGQISSRSGGKAGKGGTRITPNTLALTSVLASILIYCRFKVVLQYYTIHWL